MNGPRYPGYPGRAEEPQRMMADTAVMWQLAGLLENPRGSQTSVGSWSQKMRWFFEANTLSHKQHRPVQIATAAQQRTGAQPAHDTFLPPNSAWLILQLREGWGLPPTVGTHRVGPGQSSLQ